MTDPVQPARRQMLRLFAVTGATAGIAALSVPSSIASTPCATDGTPLQFVPKTQPDPNPLDNELARYPKCPSSGNCRHD
jgi:hypothetical protein